MSDLGNTVDLRLQHMRQMTYKPYEFQDEGCRVRDEITDKILLEIEGLDDLLLTCNITEIVEE